MGELAIGRRAEGFSLCHTADREAPELQEFSKPEDARQLALYDDAGAYRPLKTAPNLRHGWRLTLPDLESLRRALDFFYPAMLGVWLDFREGRAAAVPLRETLERQSGMYAVTRRLTDEQAQEMIGGFCRSEDGCLKQILWPVAVDVPIATLPREKFDPGARGAGELPLLCHEACNLLVARAREVVKGAQ